MRQRLSQLFAKRGAKDEAARTAGEELQAARQIAEDGYCVLEKVLTPAECDRICADFDAYVEGNRAEADKFVMSTSMHSRLCNLHLVSSTARAAIAKPRVMNALDALFEDRAYVATSLYFEQSSEQAIHRDTPFFHTRPRMMFAGIWFALEDVHPDSGPLRYFPGGHRLQVAPPQIKTKEELGAAFTSYCDEIARKVREQELPEKLGFIKKGDCLIWHPELPHGGSPIKSPGMTRKSVVFHCAPESTTMYGADEFFGLQPFEDKQHPLVPLADGRKMINHGAPCFAHNN